MDDRLESRHGIVNKWRASFVLVLDILINCFECLPVDQRMPTVVAHLSPEEVPMVAAEIRARRPKERMLRW